MADNIGDEMNRAVEMIYGCQGKVVVLGIGKTGIIGHKIAASLASTGTPSFFINAAEAMHGDLGMVAKGDIAILVSHSGSTHEILNILQPLKKIGARIIAITGNLNSRLAREAEVVLSVAVDHEVCPLNLAPTTSTTATLLLSDALVVCLMERRHFTTQDFALYHPGGALGRQLLTHVSDEMSHEIPRVQTTTAFKDVIYTVSDKRKGFVMVYDHDKAIGIITDGDIRRAVQKFDDIKELRASDFMTKGFKSIHQDALLTQAITMMEINKITSLAVTETPQSKELIGIITIHDILTVPK
jgi:arabinose-5-phosphate isomerase